MHDCPLCCWPGGRPLSVMLLKHGNEFCNDFGSKFMTKTIPKFERYSGNEGPHGWPYYNGRVMTHQAFNG